jgi:hypothetical protein
MNQLVTLSKRMQYLLKAKKMESYFHVRDRNSQQKLLLTHKKMKQIAVIASSTAMKPTASKEVIPVSLEKTVVSLI